MQKTILYLFLPLLLLICSPISSLAADKPPPPEEVEIQIDRASREELKRFKPSTITEADVENLEMRLLQTIRHHLGAEQIVRDEYGQKVRDDNGKKQTVWVRGPMAKIQHQTRHFPAEAIVFYSAIGATMFTQAYYESRLMDGRTTPDWVSGLYHELTSPVGLFSFYCFLLASGQTGMLAAKGLRLEKRIDKLKKQRLKEAGKITPAFLKEHKKALRQLSWHSTWANQLGLAIGIMASSVVTELHYTIQKPSFKHCTDSLRSPREQTLSSQNQELQCDLFWEELGSTASTWIPAVYSVVSASLISSKVMHWVQTGGRKVKGTIPFIKNLTFNMKEETQKKLIATLAGKYLILPARTGAIKLTQGLMKFANLFLFMEIDQQITHKIFDPINKRGGFGAIHYLFGVRGASAVSGGHLGDLRNSIEDFTKKYLQMNPDEDTLNCEENECEYHPVLTAAHQNAQQFSQLRTYLSMIPMGAYNNWLLYINNAIGSAIAAEDIYTSLVSAATQAERNLQAPAQTDSTGTDTGTDSPANAAAAQPTPALFNQEHYFISEEDSLADYEPTLLKDMRKTPTELGELEETITRLKQELENTASLEQNSAQASEDNSDSEAVDTVTSDLTKFTFNKFEAISDAEKQIAAAKKFHLFDEVLDELREYKNTHNINCQNQTMSLPTVSLGISRHRNSGYYFLELPTDQAVLLWSDTRRVCTLERMFNIAYSSDVEPFYTDRASAQQQAEDIIRTTMGNKIADAGELHIWSLDLLRKRVLSAGLELLDRVSKDKSQEIYNQEHGSTLVVPALFGVEHLITPSEAESARIDEMIEEDFFVKLHKKMKGIKSYPRGELYTQKLNNHYKAVSAELGYQYTPAFLGLNMFRPGIMDFILASFLCGQDNELFENAILTSVPQELTEGRQWTKIVDERLPALDRMWFQTHYTMNPPQFPFLKLSTQELSSLCADNIQTISANLGSPINNRTIRFRNTSYPNLLHLVLDHIDLEQLRNYGSIVRQNMITGKQEVVEELIKESQSVLDELNGPAEDFIQNNSEFIQFFYNEKIQSIEQQRNNEEITEEEYNSKFAVYNSIIHRIESGQLADISWDTLQEVKTHLKTNLEDNIKKYSQPPSETDINNIDKHIAAMTPAELFQEWWQHKIVPSIENFLKLSNEEFATMKEFQFPGPLFQNTVSEVELTSHETVNSYYSDSNVSSSEENTSLFAQLFPSLMQNNQLDSFTSVMPFLSAGSGFSTSIPSSALITSHKNTLTVPEGIFANIHFEMTYWADLILDMAKRKANMDSNVDIDLAVLQQQLHTLTDLYNVDKLNYNYLQSTMPDILPEENPSNSESISSQVCGTIDKGTLWGGIKDFFRPVQVSDKCKDHHEIFLYYFSNEFQTENVIRKRCLRIEYLPQKIGEQLGIDTSVLYTRRGNSDDEKLLSFFTENSMYEENSSESDTLLDQLLKYALVRLQTLAEEVDQAVDMYWNASAAKKEHHTYSIPEQKGSCEAYEQQLDEHIQHKVELAAQAESEAIAQAEAQEAAFAEAESS